jgi:hypothetical protein
MGTDISEKTAASIFRYCEDGSRRLLRNLGEIKLHGAISKMKVMSINQT